MNKIAIDIGREFFGPSIGGSHGNASILKSVSGIGSLVSLFLNIAFTFTGILLLLFFLIGGIGLMSSAGKNDPQKAEQSKKTITSAVIGFIVVFTSYWIVKLLGQIFGIPDII